MTRTAAGPTIRVAPLTSHERTAINILTPEERKSALLAAARAKAQEIADRWAMIETEGELLLLAEQEDQ